jgi:hypothetical protein
MGRLPIADIIKYIIDKFLEPYDNCFILSKYLIEAPWESGTFVFELQYHSWSKSIQITAITEYIPSAVLVVLSYWNEKNVYITEQQLLNQNENKTSISFRISFEDLYKFMALKNHIIRLSIIPLSKPLKERIIFYKDCHKFSNDLFINNTALYLYSDYRLKKERNYIKMILKKYKIFSLAEIEYMNIDDMILLLNGEEKGFGSRYGNMIMTKMKNLLIKMKNLPIDLIRNA